MKKMFVVSFLFLATSVFGAGYDMRSSIDIENVFPPQTITASATSDAVDIYGFRGATISVQQSDSNNSESNNIAWNLLESDSENGTYTPVIYSQLKGTDVSENASGTFLNITENASATHSEIAYMGNKSFLKIEASVKGSVSVPVSVSVIRQSPYTGR